MSLAQKAYEIAEKQHDGEKDKGDSPFILHPLRVGLNFTDDDELMAAAFLHDVVEDTDMTLDDLAQEFPPRVIRIVDAVTRRVGETYMDFIRRCAGDPDGRRVKLADIQDNLRPGYSKPSLRERYIKALRYLV